MDQRTASRLVAHAAIVVLIGLAAGFPYGTAVTSGDDAGLRAWRMAHLEGLLNGILMLAVAGTAPLLALSPRVGRWLYLALLVTGYGNALAASLAATARVRGLEPGGPTANWLVFGGFMAAVLAVVLAMVWTTIGGFRAGRNPPS